MKLLYTRDGKHVVEVDRGWWRWRYKERFIGNGTVWNSYKTGRRGSIEMEQRITDFIHMWMHEGGPRDETSPTMPR